MKDKIKIINRDQLKYIAAFYMLRDKPVWRFIAYELIMMGYIVGYMGVLMALLDFLTC